MDTKALRQKVLDLAIRGKLVPQNPNDEPASVLLERIRTEKQQMVKQGKLKVKDIKNDSVIFVGEDSLHYEKFTDGTVKCIEDEIPFEVPEGWAWTRLQSIASVLTDGTHKTPKYSDEGYVFLSSRNVTFGKIDWENIVYIPESLHQELYNRLAPRVGDILLAKNGTTGVAAIVNRNTIFDIYVSLALIRITEKIIDSRYILYAIGSTYIQNYFNNSLKGIGVPNLHLEHIRKTLIPIPPDSEQSKIISKIDCMLPMVEDIAIAKMKLNDLISSYKDKILELAIRGQLVPQNPDDEPVSVLIEHIQVEKEELIKQGKIKRNKKETTIFKGEDNSYYQRIEADGNILVQRINIPLTWAACSIQEISYLISTTDIQVKSNEILEKGKFPVVSQGREIIDGYCNDQERVIYDIPIILFGDHTRNVKYIDFPFIVGADGTKIHKALQLNEKYFYYWMSHASQCILDRGYSRHYGLLQKESVSIPPVAEQSRIVDCIEKLFNHLDSITQALS